MRVDVLVPPEAVQSPSAWEIENVISQFIVPLVTVEDALSPAARLYKERPG